MEENNKQEEAGKIGKKFEASMKSFTALLNGEALFKSMRVGKGEDLDKAVQELAKEEKEDLMKRFKEGVKALIKDKRDFDKFQKEKLKEFNKAVEDKQKAFNEQADKLFALIEDIKGIEKGYYDTMTSS